MPIATPYLSENSLISYPLAQDQNVPEEIKKLIVDATITFCLPFYCTPTGKSIDIFTGDYKNTTITLGSEESQSDFATLTNFFMYSSGTVRYESARAIGDCGQSTPGEDDQAYLAPTICLVINYDQARALTTDGDWHWSGSLRFDLHAISYEPRRYEKLVLNKARVGGVTEENVEIYPAYYRQNWFLGGHNVSVVQAPKDERSGAPGLLISASPGIGEGLVPCDCGEDGKTILSGNVQIIGDGGCTVVEPSPADPPGSSEPHIIIHDSCTACCQCSQYKEKVDVLRNSANTLYSLGKSLKRNIEKLNRSISSYNSQGCSSDCEMKRGLSASGYNPSPKSGKGVARVFAVGSITNMCFDTYQVTVSQYTIDGGKPEPGTTQWTIVSSDNKARTKSGLPAGVDLKPGETIKVIRTFIMNDPYIVPYPYDVEYGQCFSKTIQFQGHDKESFNVTLQQDC